MDGLARHALYMPKTQSRWNGAVFGVVVRVAATGAPSEELRVLVGVARRRVRAGQAAARYSWTSPPRRSCRAICGSGSAAGGRGGSAQALGVVRARTRRHGQGSRRRARAGGGRWVDAGANARKAARQYGSATSRKRLADGGGRSVDVDARTGCVVDAREGLIDSRYSAKPSDGLEPSTPSLPFAPVHARSSPTRLLVQIRPISGVGERRETSCGSFPMCPFCVRVLSPGETTRSRLGETGMPAQGTSSNAVVWLGRTTPK
jgi:hypothetical protein